MLVNAEDENMSEARKSRVEEERFDEEFTEPNWLSIPDSVVDRFKDEGMVLRWIRITINGQDDYKNVGDRQNDGWTFVEPNDVPEMMVNSRIVDEGRFEGCVVRGDVALAKASAKRMQSRQEYYQNRSRTMMDNVNAQLMNQSNSAMPIHNNSKSSVTRGRTPSFND
jgi:hypothetical protein|tara:strand:+ start:269 stop:769 length:501 start_codon:yes stop_codon:yes gene_type:complete